jgi:hypothetical protein
MALSGMLPISTADTYCLASNVVYYNPVFGTLCMVLVAPFITCGFFYASVFSTVGYWHPLLAYPATALALALPRIASACLYWDPRGEMILYFAQLPIHMLACWAYQKTDNVWSPIILHILINLISSAMILVTGYAM